MWQKPLKKTIFTLDIDNYAPEITAVTYPFIEHYAEKIGADFHIITQRKFPEFPLTYEKFQIYELAQEMENDWNIYIDADTLVHPETIDFTLHVQKDTVIHHDKDMANVRWKYDRFFYRDGRNIGSCNWLAIASDWCIELWKPPEDLTVEEAVRNIFPTVEEKGTVIKPGHLIDDYIVSRNIAKYGLKFASCRDILLKLNLPLANFFFHQYTFSKEEKLKQIKEVLGNWRIQNFLG
jgi:hypothetical protein